MAVYGKFFFAGDAPEGGDSFRGAINNPDVWQPPADLLEVDGGLLVHMDLPGVSPGGIEATIEGKYLIIRGIRDNLCPARGRRYLQMEICKGIFGKIITLPVPVLEANCTATLKNGVLEIFLPMGKAVGYVPTAIRIDCAP